MDIDFGEVSIRMRNILRSQGRKRWSPGTWASMHYLNMTDPRTLKLMRKALIQWGYASQRLGHRLARGSGLLSGRKRPATTTGKPGVRAQVINFVAKPMPARLPPRPMRALLGVEDERYVSILRDPGKADENADAVFYFPGCGSERLFSDVGLATLALLYETGAETVLPPGYLCCGYPQRSAGDERRGRQISTANQVLFHRVANTLNYLDIRTVIVSCGTCIDQLLTYQFHQIFPGCRLLDIHEYLMEKGLSVKAADGVQYLYHDPCHSPMKLYQPIEVAAKLVGKPVTLSDRCCGEAGTFAIARPDVATQVRFRKQEELELGVEQLTADAPEDRVKVLTSCPACLQGLSRYREEVAAEPAYIVTELADRLLGEGWQSRFVDTAKAGGIERVLL